MTEPASSGFADPPRDDGGISAQQSGLGAVRLRLDEGDLARARARFDRIDPRLLATPEGWLTEARLLEAEGQLDEALERVRRVIPLRRGSVQVNAQLARIAARLELAQEAEVAARSALAVEPDNLDALDALVLVYHRESEAALRIGVLRRIALAAQANEAKVWQAIETLTRMSAWPEILDIVAQRADDLNPRRVARTRLDGLLALGWGRRALAFLREAHDAGLLRTGEAVEWLIARGALVVAAWFVQDGRSQDGAFDHARAAIIARAGEVSQSVRLTEAPLVVADAIGARALLLPEREALTQANSRAVEFLVRQAAIQITKGEAALASDYLIVAARLAPGDLSILERLAMAAERAGRDERRLDTLMRIAKLSPDAERVIAAAAAACAAGDWSLVHAALDLCRAQPTSEASVRARLHKRFAGVLTEQMARQDWRSALALVAGLRQTFAISAWPSAAVNRLLAGAKRWLRSGPSASDASIEAACADYLEIDPTDLDIRRQLARIWLRQKRTAESAELLRGALAIDPHVARDWIVLAQALHEMGDGRGRDYCTARALAIAPDSVLPATLKSFVDRMAPA